MIEKATAILRMGELDALGGTTSAEAQAAWAPWRPPVLLLLPHTMCVAACKRAH